MSDSRLTIWNYPVSFPAILLAGIFFRLIFFPFFGFMQDFYFFSSWAQFLAQHPITAIYDNPDIFDHHLINYPPLYLYILTFIARVYRFLTDASFESRWFLMMMKTVTLLFEIALAWVVYRFVRSKHSEKEALLASAFYFCNPAMVYVGAYYGQVDAIFAMFLLLSVLFFLSGRNILGGAFAALSLLMKVQTIPFLPFLFFIPLAKRNWRGVALSLVGFVICGFALVFPFWLEGKLALIVQRCVFENVDWSNFLSVGAFNAWYLHAEPYTQDHRLWGFLYGSDGKVVINSILQLLTYKNLGVGLYGCVFLSVLWQVWRKPTHETVLAGGAHLALAFFMFATKVHERYLFPFFVFYVVLLSNNAMRSFVFWALSLTYLLNLNVICPLFGGSQQVQQIDSRLGVWVAAANVVLYSMFLVTEYPHWFQNRWLKIPKPAVVFAVLLLAIGLMMIRSSVRNGNDEVLYLSSIDPLETPQQDWPPIPPEYGGVPPYPYYQVGRDLSLDGHELQIRQTRYRYGLGVHANSKVVYEVPGDYTLFECEIGVDWEVNEEYHRLPDRATVVFEVWVNGERRYQSNLMIPSLPARRVSIQLPVKQKKHRIELIVRDGDGRNFADHADWALVCVFRGYRTPGDRVTVGNDIK